MRWEKIQLRKKEATVVEQTAQLGGHLGFPVEMDARWWNITVLTSGEQPKPNMGLK